MLKRCVYVSVVLLCSMALYAQQSFNIQLLSKNESCAAGWAELKIVPRPHLDSMQISWSTGATGDLLLTNLSEGNYQVQVKIQQSSDSGHTKIDTLLNFSIGREVCPVGIDKYFSPNGDNYHDFLNVSYWQKYPNFELLIYNKWGQRVHHQEKVYEPWDGTWNGINLPDGTYYYLFFYDAGDKGNVLKGDVTILR